MYIQALSIARLSSFVLLLGDGVSATPITKEGAERSNANHIFNTIHSSMRQWGSSLNHNGMSFFMATVPAGTQLYHGTSSKEVVKGLEWLAFEPEHALVFARPRGGKGRPGHGDKGEKERERAAENAFECHLNGEQDPWSRQGHAHTPPPLDANDPPEKWPGYLNARPHHDIPSPPPSPHDGEHQRPIPNDPDHPHGGQGYLHIYAPIRPLRLLYIDGLSAGKTSNGTLDTQDILLLNNSTSPDAPMMGEYARARGLCNLWPNKIDGILRMEAGFEIILCEFKGRVERKSVTTYDSGSDEWQKKGVMGGWRYIKAVAERYHGIGGNRVTLDYENFVSAFAFDRNGELGLWKNDVISDTPHPRLINASPEQLGSIRDAVTSMILESDRGQGKEEGRDWQAIADMVVKRYASSIHHLHTDPSVRRSKEAFAAYLSTLLRPFVSPSERNYTLETQRCTAQFVPPIPLPPHKKTSLAHETIHTVTTHICSTLLNAFDASTLTLSRSLAATSSPPYHALDLIDSLAGYLQWTTWKECGTCADEEVCFIPVWPMGSLENHKNPQCVGEDGVGRGYWGHGHGPPPPPEGDRPGRGHDDPAHGEGAKLREHEGSHGPVRLSSARGGWEHGSEHGLRRGGRPRHAGRGKGGHCGAPRMRAPRPRPVHVHGSWDRGAWDRLRASVMQMVA